MSDNITQAEEAIIGCIIADYENVLPEIMPILKEADFYVKKYADIYSACLKLYQENKAIDPISIHNILPDIKISELSGLADYVVSSAFVRTYCDIVKNASKTRQLDRILLAAKKALADGETYEAISGRLTDSLAEIESARINEFISAKDVIFDIYQEVKKGKITGLKTGFKKIDKIMHGLQKSNLITLAADTGKGKTALALNIAANVLADNKTVLLYSLEMSASENIKRLLSIISETNSNVSDSDLFPDDVNKRLNGCNFIMEHNFFVNDKQQSVDTVAATSKAKMNELRRKGGTIDLIIVDYVQILSGSGRAENRQSEVAGIAQRLKGLAKEINIPVIILSQVNAEYEKDKRQLRLNDLRESKAIAHASDIVMILNKDKDDFRDPNYTLNILKNRNGPLFYMKLEFIREYTKFIETEKEETHEAPEWQKN